jgi:DNA-binding transcriptional MerR regulator
MNTNQNLSNFRQVPWVRVLSVTAGAIGLAVFAPIVWLAATGGVGLLVLGGVLAVGFAGVQALPLMGQKLENGLLAARKAEARRSPIEQLQNEVLRRAERLKAFRGALVKVGGQIETIEQMLEERRHGDPKHMPAAQVRALARLQQFHRINLGKLNEAHNALKEFQETVKRKESDWAISIAIGDAGEMMDPNATDNLLQDLLTDTALRTVQDRFNCVFAELDVQMSSTDGPTRTLLDDRSLDRMDALHLPETVNVTRSYQ